MRLLWVLGMAVLFLGADYNEKGMRVYKKNCKPCHGSGDYGAPQLEQEAWEDLFMFNASKLKKAHDSQPEVQSTIKIFSKAQRENLADFLVGNAKDSGAVGGCDGNRCGVKRGNVKMTH